jgi:AcrR family transcriptional regulator
MYAEFGNVCSMVNANPTLPRKSARVEARKQRTRAAILSAAAELFTRQGYETSTMQEIATLADVGLGTMYGYFPSKEDVLRTILDERRQQAASRSAAAVAAARSTLDRICTVLDQVYLYLSDNRPLAMALFAIEASRPRDERSGMEQPFGALLEFLRHGQSRGEIAAVPVEATVRSLLSTYYWAALRLGLWRNVAQPETIQGDLAVLTRRLLAP